jgi:tetratricopeptide (TPR) repeat protein
MAKEYKLTLFDKYGPAAGDYLRAGAYGLMVFGISIAAFFIIMAQGMMMGDAGGPSLGLIFLVVVGAAAAGAATSLFAFALSHGAGATYKHLMMSGSSTPYKEQYSYQQALVMQGKVDEALESFEAVIAEKPDAVDARIKAAELYAREKKNYIRAAQLFRDVQRIPTLAVGEDVYAANRLVDLLTGPLNEPGRALAELRRLIDRYPGSTAADHARGALAHLKKQLHDSTSS